MKTRVIELSVNNRKEVIELPINPPSVEFTEKQLNQAITLLNIGEANLKGERGLSTQSCRASSLRRSLHFIRMRKRSLTNM